VLQLNVGDRAPEIVGATQDRQFYSLDAQAGRPAIFVPLGAGGPDAAKALFDRVRAALTPFRAAGVDVRPLAPQAASFAAVFAGDVEADEQIVYVAQAGGLETFSVDGCPAAIVTDRSGRIVHVAPLSAKADLVDIYRRLEPQLTSEPPRRCASSAPVLIIPNVIAPEDCEALVANFETSPHKPGVMASVTDGAPAAKLDESKKRRRDIELIPNDALYATIVEVLAKRCAPEIKRAFQADITYADRILIARYDDTGGYFKRHRDNVAPQTAFREFAISINLNTHDYDGGELLFPEYDDHRYSPPAGSAIVFSASLLHEAAPVTKGRRYVLLSFLCTAKAQADVAQAR
jgi:predicted 2-oxoglutarate/Fe(II)-dependent dioxygenase YbiX